MTEEILSVFTSRKFKREKPDIESLRSAITLAVEKTEPVRFVMYWGKGENDTVGPWEKAGLIFLDEFLDKIRQVYKPGVSITIIFTDTHASLNGHTKKRIETYIRSLRELLEGKGVELVLMTEMLGFDLDKLEERLNRSNMDDSLLVFLKKSAEKHSFSIKDYEKAARLYYLQNQEEKIVVEQKFHNCIFITYNGSESDILLPPHLPKFHMYSIKRGTSVKPWFCEEEFGHRSILSISGGESRSHKEKFPVATQMNYSIVSYLTGREYEEVRKLQEELFEITGSRKCLDDWQPHLTVGDGIIVEKDYLPEIENRLKNFCDKGINIVIKTKGFGGIENWKGAIPGEITPYVIWLDVEVSPELQNLFDNLRDEITSKFKTWLPRTVNFNPHVTLAFVDLTEEGYRKGMEYVENLEFDKELNISSVSLTECFGKGSMTSHEYRRFNLGSKPIYLSP